jgi:hypothetical protein
VSDIVERLRSEWARFYVHQAADEIVRLRAERDEARYETHVLRVSNATLSENIRAAEAERDRLRDALTRAMRRFELMSKENDSMQNGVRPSVGAAEARAALGDTQ